MMKYITYDWVDEENFYCILTFKVRTRKKVSFNSSRAYVITPHHSWIKCLDFRRYPPLRILLLHLTFDEASRSTDHHNLLNAIKY